jgi:outer membrane immunogenic protein
VEVPVKYFRSAALAALAAIGFASLACAADLPTKKAPLFVAPALVPYNWTGFYVGLNAGGAFGDPNSETPTGLFPAYAGSPRLPSSSNQSAFTGGSQIGYNYQVSSVVFGLEADFDYIGLRRNSFTVAGLPPTPFGFGAAPNVFNYSSSNSDFLGTVRARLGYAVDRALIYVTGGLAYSGGASSAVASFTNVGGAQYATFQGPSSSNIGYAVGGGLEYALTDHWTVKGEYLYANLGRRNVTLTDPVTPGGAGYSFTAKIGESVNIARAGVNYKF